MAVFPRHFEWNGHQISAMSSLRRGHVHVYGLPLSEGPLFTDVVRDVKLGFR